MSSYEVPVVADGDHVVDMLNAVKLMTQLTDGTTNGQFSAILATVGMVGLIIVMISLILRGNIQSLYQWMIAYALVFGVLFVPKVDVIVNDRSDPTIATNPVENVPLGVGALAWFTTSFGDRVATSLETIMAPADAVSYQGGNMLWGQKVMSEMPGMKYTDARVANNMNSYLRACVFPTIAANPLEMQAIKTSTDLWAHLASNAPNTRVTSYTTSAGVTSTMACRAAASLITPDLNAEATAAMEYYGERLFPDLDGSDAATAFQNDLGTIHDVFIGVSRNGGEMLKQVMMLNQFEKGLQGYASDAAAASIMSYMESRAETQSRLTMSGLGTLMQSAVPRLYTLMFVLLIAIFPFIVAMGLIPGIGLSVVKNYVFGFVYLQAFPVLFIIINRIIVIENAKLTSAAAKNIGGSGISYQNLGILSEIPSETSAMAAVMLSLIPVIAGIFTKGISTLGGQMENILRPMQVATESAAQEAATGNIAVQTANINTAQQDTASRNQVNTSPFVDSTMNLRRNEDGVVVGQSQSGKLHVRANDAQSSMMVNPSTHAGFVNTVSRNRTDAEAQEQIAGREYSESLEQTNGQALQLALQSAAGADLQQEIGFTASQEAGKALDGFHEEVTLFSDRTGLSRADTVELFAEASVGGWSPWASAQAGGRTGLSGQHTQDAELLAQATEQIQSSESLSNLRTALLSSTDSSSLSKSTAFGDQLLNSLNETRSASERLSETSAKRQMLEEMETQARSTDASVMANLSQPMMNYIQDNYGDETALVVGSDISASPRAMAIQMEAAEFVTQQSIDQSMSRAFSDPRTGEITRGDVPAIDQLFSDVQQGYGANRENWQAMSTSSQQKPSTDQWNPTFEADLYANREAVRESVINMPNGNGPIGITDEGDLTRSLETPVELARAESSALFEETKTQKGIDAVGDVKEGGVIPIGNNYALGAAVTVGMAMFRKNDDVEGEPTQGGLADNNFSGPPVHSEMAR